ncbi:efflux RND transporter periplasmic adaptor subunit [Celeribacter arenosi]
MRIVPIIIAAITTLTLYLFVFQRDMLFDIATPDSASPAVVQEMDPEDAETAQTEDNFAPPAEQAKAEVVPIPVVARHSVSRVLDRAVVLRGETEAARSVNVSAETSGRVISEPLRKGTYVDAGTLLCELDPGTRQAALLEAKAALPTAEARVAEANSFLSEAETNLTNAERLAEGGYASDTRVISARAALESARAGISAAEAGVQSARAGIAASEKEIERLTILAPFAGLLETDSAELGALMQPGSVCATIVELDPIKLVAYAPETNVDLVEVGSIAGARLISGQEVTGRVSFLSRSADPATRTFRVEVEIPNPDFAIRDGQTVEMVIAAEGTKAHLVAQSTLTLDDDGQIGVRIVGPDNVVAFNAVEILRDTREGVWVAGLADEADIITVGHEYVRAGVLVDPHYQEITQ